MTQASRKEPAVVVGKTYDLVLWLLPRVEKFARSYRFTLGDRLVSYGLDLLLVVVASAYAGEKVALLEQASAKVNGLRYLLRVSKDLRLLSIDSYGRNLSRLARLSRPQPSSA